MLILSLFDGVFSLEVVVLQYAPVCSFGQGESVSPPDAVCRWPESKRCGRAAAPPDEIGTSFVLQVNGRQERLAVVCLVEPGDVDIFIGV